MIAAYAVLLTVAATMMAAVFIEISKYGQPDRYVPRVKHDDNL